MSTDRSSQTQTTSLLHGTNSAAQSQSPDIRKETQHALLPFRAPKATITLASSEKSPWASPGASLGCGSDPNELLAALPT